MMKPLYVLSSILFMSIATTGCGNASPPQEAPEAQETSPPAVTETTEAPATEQEVALVEEEAAAEASSEETAEATDDSVSKTKMVDGYEEIFWEDMMPEGEEERLMQMVADLQSGAMGYGGIAEGSSADKAVQVGTFNVVKEMDGLKIRLPGYTVPFEYTPDSKVNEFLLVPYFGACLHAPPPPPNQTLYVKSEKPIRIGDLAQAVWVYGTLHTETQKSELADTAYTLTLDKVEEYKY